MSLPSIHHPDFAEQFIHSLFANAHTQFDTLALALFQWQYHNNEIYRKYCLQIGRSPESVGTIDRIPFLPISFYKSHRVVSGKFEADITFSSSGTGGQASLHHLKSLPLYEQSFLEAFESSYGHASDYCFLALLPAYLERKGSSLIYMAQVLMDKSEKETNGFFLDQHEVLLKIIAEEKRKGSKVVLLGVSFALMDLVENCGPQDLEGVIVMETGGMKGRRKEITRAELHEFLSEALNVTSIHSEYGMTELLSQAYAKKDGIFEPPPWMKVLIRDQSDPFSYLPKGKGGAVNIIDLANVYSCAFIQSDDLGRKLNDEQFEILGRFDHASIRGCNLMVV